jgi:hypothetical protein
MEEGSRILGLSGALIVLPLLLGISGLVIAQMVRQRRRADAVCGEIMDAHMPEVKMIEEAKLIRKFGFNRGGLLVMFKHGLTFIPTGKGERIEMPFSQITRVDRSQRGLWSISPVRKLDIYLNNTLYSFSASSFVSTAWMAGIEKMVPALGPQPIR